MAIVYTKLKSLLKAFNLYSESHVPMKLVLKLDCRTFTCKRMSVTPKRVDTVLIKPIAARISLCLLQYAGVFKSCAWRHSRTDTNNAFLRQSAIIGLPVVKVGGTVQQQSRR